VLISLMTMFGKNQTKVNEYAGIEDKSNILPIKDLKVSTN